MKVLKAFGFGGTPNPLQALPELSLSSPCALGRKLQLCCCNYKPILHCWIVVGVTGCSVRSSVAGVVLFAFTVLPS